MERHALQIVLLAFLLAAAVPCAASEASGSEPEPDFTVTISKEGITENSQREFSLGPSATLRVVDETGKATLLPAPTTAGDSEAGQYSVAYVFENGQCNFEKTVAYKDAFPGYSEELWVRTGTETSTRDEGTGEGGNYTFTNPPDEYLSGGVSFCVRFTTATSTATPTPSPSSPGTSAAPGSTAASGGGGAVSGSQGELGEMSEDDPKKPGSTGPGTSESLQESDGEQTVVKENEDTHVATPAREQQDGKTEPVSPALEPMTDSSETERITVETDPVSDVNYQATDGDGHARLRRLSDSDASEVKYLTIVVHSAACGSTAAALAMSAALLVMTVILQYTV
ncbi:unnamed protein product [Neospora caninum Liverpool]|uniref:Toxoplasma gondii family A protein n=1 Tax=Neospora caninum (strain Liverpool) TaxID=572307 RepID=F0VE64_NEOCL|nr:uncharacterized protein NCLIV_017980 [Neospora caninum Liverpool]CBZ52008.1 unnamed protein product [Neospora caninum Liverpool]CEL65969.1 TPA: hypothetical protein BN1204_017980 [Neospora caninum Liverpool]|eukprot:XP_003882040.1 uncharacterized protein NCLIV_017980 [Neospora caninum Liverpool]